MKGIRIAITQWQHEQLKPFFDETRIAAEAGSPIGLFAQIFESTCEEDPEGWLDIRLVDRSVCEKIQSAVGVEPGKATELDKTVMVLAPEGDDN